MLLIEYLAMQSVGYVVSILLGIIIIVIVIFVRWFRVPSTTSKREKKIRQTSMKNSVKQSSCIVNGPRSKEVVGLKARGSENRTSDSGRTQRRRANKIISYKLKKGSYYFSLRKDGGILKLPFLQVHFPLNCVNEEKKLQLKRVAPKKKQGWGLTFVTPKFYLSEENEFFAVDFKLPIKFDVAISNYPGEHIKEVRVETTESSKNLSWVETERLNITENQKVISVTLHRFAGFRIMCEENSSNLPVLYHAVFVKRPHGIEDPTEQTFGVLIHSDDGKNSKEANKILHSHSTRIIFDKASSFMRPPGIFKARLKCGGMTSKPEWISYKVNTEKDKFLKTFYISIKKRPVPVSARESVILWYEREWSTGSSSVREEPSRLRFQWPEPLPQKSLSGHASLNGGGGAVSNTVINYHVQMPMEVPDWKTGSSSLQSDPPLLPGCTISNPIENKEKSSENLYMQKNDAANSAFKKGDTLKNNPTGASKKSKNTTGQSPCLEEPESGIDAGNYIPWKPWPKTVNEALAGQKSGSWQSAMKIELDSLVKNNTWKVVELPSGSKVLRCRWVFKHEKIGDCDRFRARLIVKNLKLTQKDDFDYDQIFSPVARHSTFRTVLAVALEKDMLIHQMDVHTAFSNGVLNGEVYMELPEHYDVKSGCENMVCKLEKSLYGSREQSVDSNIVVREHLGSLGFKISKTDPCVFVRNTDQNLFIILAFVDDLILASKSAEELQNVKDSLTSETSKLHMTDLGKLHCCLGVSIEQDAGNKCVLLHQKLNVDEMLCQFQQTDAKKSYTPSDTNEKLKKEDESGNANKGLYCSMVRSLSCIAEASRPDIEYAVRKVSRFTSNPSTAHLTAVKRIMHYLKATADLALKFEKTEKGLLSYSDASWAEQECRHSTSGNLFILAGCSIGWLSQEQKKTACTSDEAEYIGLFLATKEIRSLRSLLSDLGYPESGCSRLLGDNQTSIAIGNQNINFYKTKAIDVKYHIVQEAVKDGIIALEYCETKEMVADILTKALPKPQFEELRVKMGLVRNNFKH